MLIRLFVCGYMACARLAELAYSRRNLASFEAAAEGERSRGTYPLMVALHTAVIGGTALFGRRPRYGWLLALALVQPLRAWVLASLGRRWNARAAVPGEMEIETGGPYAYVRHPNYTVVAVELVSLPLAFGLAPLALAATAANAWLMAARIPEEEALLLRLPGYREHFEGKPRFLPRLLLTLSRQ